MLITSNTVHVYLCVWSCECLCAYWYVSVYMYLGHLGLYQHEITSYLYILTKQKCSYSSQWSTPPPPPQHPYIMIHNCKLWTRWLSTTLSTNIYHRTQPHMMCPKITLFAFMVIPDQYETFIFVCPFIFLWQFILKLDDSALKHKLYMYHRTLLLRRSIKIAF